MVSTKLGYNTEKEKELNFKDCCYDADFMDLIPVPVVAFMNFRRNQDFLCASNKGGRGLLMFMAMLCANTRKINNSIGNMASIIIIIIISRRGVQIHCNGIKLLASPKSILACPDGFPEIKRALIHNFMNFVFNNKPNPSMADEISGFVKQNEAHRIKSGTHGKGMSHPFDSSY